MCVKGQRFALFRGGWRYVSLFLYVCGRALDDLTKILPLYVLLLVDVLCINFNNVEGLSLFLLLVWGVVSKKFSKFVWFDLATTKF